MWLRLSAAVIRTGWGTVEDILQRPWDFPCGSNPQPPRTLPCTPSRAIEDKQEETGEVLSPSTRHDAGEAQWAPWMAVLQILQASAHVLC